MRAFDLVMIAIVVLHCGILIFISWKIYQAQLTSLKRYERDEEFWGFRIIDLISRMNEAEKQLDRLFVEKADKKKG